MFFFPRLNMIVLSIKGQNSSVDNCTAIQYMKVKFLYWAMSTLAMNIYQPASLKYGFDSCVSSWGSKMEKVTSRVSEQKEEDVLGEEGTMLWSIQEALEKQTLQIGASACGATAVVDVLKALDVDVAPEEADRCVQTRLRRNNAPLPDYLLSRSEAGECLQKIVKSQSVTRETFSKAAFNRGFFFVQVPLMLSSSRGQRRRVRGRWQVASSTFTLDERSGWSPGWPTGSVKVPFLWQPWTCS